MHRHTLSLLAPALWSTLLLATITLHAQPVAPKDYGLKEFTLKDKQLGAIHFFVDTVNLPHKAPLFIDANGSGGAPLCLYIQGKGNATVFNTFNPFVSEKVRERFHYVILSKPGTAFCDTEMFSRNAQGVDFQSALESYAPSKEYNERLSLQWRVAATSKVIGWLISHNYWDGTKIVAYGYSEGAHMVPSLAVADKRVTHVVAVVGQGLNQFYNNIAMWRVSAAKGEMTPQRAQDSIDNYLKIVKDIYAHPAATDKYYDGHTYKRWASFCSTIPLKEMKKLSIPIYMIAGTNDTNSPIFGLDYVQLDFLRLGKTNLTYDVCVGCVHSLTSYEDGRPTPHFDEYLDKIVKWIDAH